MELDHTKCTAATGSDGKVTAGQGKQFKDGAWEHPCEPCRLSAQGPLDAMFRAFEASE
jgi:hypothetical protein